MALRFNDARRRGVLTVENLTKRGAFVLGVAVGLLIVGLYWISGHVWWTEAGICLGSMADCNL
jgi:hypothetical protein